MLSFLVILFLFFLAGAFFLYLKERKEVAEFRRREKSLENRVSELLKSNADVIKENRYLKNLFDKGPGFVLGLSREGIVLFANQETTRFFNIPNPAGRNYWEIIRTEGLNELIARTLHDQKFREEKIDFPVENKSFSISFYPDENGLFLVGRDLTREQQLAWQRREFTANASHELRSPLSILNTALETMRQFLSKDGEKFYKIAEQQVRRLSELAKDLLTLAEVENEILPYKFEKITLSDFINEFLPHFFQRVREKDIRISIDISDKLPGVKADAARLEQVFGNLLDNALKYTPAGGQIEVSGSVSGGEVLVKISDSGIGIPPEDLPRIFERFYRADKGRSRQLGGTGLGLSIVKHIVETTGGRVWAESEINKGSAFYFTLPVWQ